MSWDNEFRDYVPVSEKKKSAQKALDRLRKKNPNIAPVLLTGKALATTFWGRAWNKNLESYADYANRIERGRTYVRQGMVLDLQIDTGLVTGLVMGSRKSPYAIAIQIDTLSPAKWTRIAQEAQHSITNLAELAEGAFPPALAERFLRQGDGLFPSPREIHMRCDCPDWADMCKHLAAMLYGIGARFDSDPLLFFKLRDIPFQALLKKTVEDKMQSLLQNAGKPSDRVLDDADIAGLFGL